MFHFIDGAFLSRYLINNLILFFYNFRATRWALSCHCYAEWSHPPEFVSVECPASVPGNLVTLQLANSSVLFCRLFTQLCKCLISIHLINRIAKLIYLFYISIIAIAILLLDYRALWLWIWGLHLEMVYRMVSIMNTQRITSADTV